jgi:hypothetical protein
MIPLVGQYLATYPDGTEALVSIYADQSAEIAHRRNQHATWGLPTQMRYEPVEVTV